MRKILRISLLGMLTMFSTMALAQTEETLTIADLHKMTKDKANITLSIADGKVVYADANAIHVRDGEYAVIFFKTNLNLPANAKVKGTVKVDYDNYYGVHEVKANAGTNTDNLTIEESTEEAVPVEATVEDILGLKHLCDLVIVKNVTITKEGQNFFIVSGDKKVQLYKGIDVSGYVDGKAYNVTGLFNNIYKKRTGSFAIKGGKCCNKRQRTDGRQRQERTCLQPRRPTYQQSSKGHLHPERTQIRGKITVANMA